MILEHVKIFTPEHIFRTGTIEIHEERIARVTFDDGTTGANDAAAGSKVNGIESSGDTGVDILYAVPGFIDMHLHGCVGRDVCDADIASLRDIAEYQLQNGVTGFAPATLTLPPDKLKRVLESIADYVNQSHTNENYVNRKTGAAADVLGINMEGPFISDAKKGAQDGRYICPADKRLIREFIEASGNLVKILGIAPERNDAAAVVRMICEAEGRDKTAADNTCPSGIHLALSHTDASYEEAIQAFGNGADHVTHLCNAMSAFHHREPGVIGAVFDACTVLGRNDITAELICDGVHVHPAMVRTVFRMLGKEHIILVSDSMRGTGLQDGIYRLGELDVEMRGSRAVLCGTESNTGGIPPVEADAFSNRPLAGSVTNLFICFQNAVREMKLPLTEVLPCVTENPARKLGVFGERGSIEAGKLADILLLDRELQLKHVIKSGIVCSG